ncbi:glycosyltransferase WbuB [Candidatus Saccharibacteria bacterium RIFCSPHIGHO2_12_FULL_41_12]|nr:MAG: glycosyltransferase WbuB [Candidatus Saccharibacteria bacterium RIFCSPHIGHO2_12_FULL_41_12]
MKKQRVLVVCQHYWPESFRINDICDFLVEKNANVEVLCGIPNYPQGKFFDGYSYFKKRKETHNDVKIRRAFEVPRGNNSNPRILINYLSFPFSSLFHIPRLLTKKYNKIILYQLSPVMMSIAGILVGKIKKIETTMYVLDLWPENLFSVINIKNPLMRKLATSVSHWHYKRIDKFVVLSEKMRSRIIDVTGVSPDKIVILPQACEKIYETDVRDKVLQQKFKKGFNILFAGNISPAQSFETIIETAKNLKTDGLSDINWIIVGDGMSKTWLEEEVKKAGLANSFYFEGMKPVADIPKYNGVADLLVGCLVKSDLLEATIPAKVMSYIASGKPMVLAMDGEVQDLINNKIKCGYVGPTEDSKALTTNIKKIYGLSPKQRSEMGNQARAYHIKHFERNLILNKLYSFIFG